MRRIKFDLETINQIREFMSSGKTLTEGCNRFNLKMDTFVRVLKENGIPWVRQSGKLQVFQVPEYKVLMICNLFENTDTLLQDICRQVKLSDFEVKMVLRKYYTEEQVKERKSRMYRKSKVGEKNPMKLRTGSNHPNYLGTPDVSDGNGYLMRVKPEWYKGRVGSHHVFTHTLVMCEALGLDHLPEGFVVHHIDGNRRNNNLNNLSLMISGAHSRIHQIQKKLAKFSKVQRLSDNGVGRNPETPDNDCHVSEVVEDIVHKK